MQALAFGNDSVVGQAQALDHIRLVLPLARRTRAAAVLGVVRSPFSIPFFK